MDYRKLAEEFGGRAESQPQEAPSIDYRALAEQFGGIAEVEPIAPVAEGKSAPAIPQLPIAPVESTVPEDEGFFGRNYRFAKDALISGYESFRANSKGEAFAISRGAMLRDEEEYGGPGIPLAPPEVRERYERNKQEAGQYAQDIAGFQKEAQERQLASPLRPETARLKAAMGDDVTFMESAKEAGAALFSNPVGVIADLGAESLPAMAYMVSTALVGRLASQNPTAAAQAGGLGSAATQFGNEYVNRLQKGESHDEAWKNASIRSGVIGVFDAVSLKTAGSAAGKIVEALKTGKPASVAAKEFIKETGKQAGLGGAGEAAGSLAIGEIPNPAAVIAEMAGETVTGPFEAISTYQRVKGIEKLSREDKAIADLDKLAADEEVEEAKRAADEEVEAATSGLIGEGDLFAEEAATAVSPQKTIPTTTATTISPEETIPATLEELKKIDKDLKKKLGRAPTFEETETALNDFEQNKTKQLQAKSGGREPTVPVLSGEEAVSGVTGAPERVEPTGLDGAVEPTDVSGARKEPTLGAVKPEDLELDDGATVLDATQRIEDKDDADLEAGIIEDDIRRANLLLNKEENKNLQEALELAKLAVQEGEGRTFFTDDVQDADRLVNDINTVFAGLENGTLTNAENNVKSLLTDAKNLAVTFKQRIAERDTFEAKRAEQPADAKFEYEERPDLKVAPAADQINTAKKMMADISKQPLNVENVAGREIVGDVKKFKGFKIYKVKEGYSTYWRAQSPENQALNKIGRGDSSHESLELAKDAVGENLNNKFDAETFAQRLLPKLTEGKATPTAPEPTRVRTVEDLSPEDKAAFNNETAEIRASMKEATDAAKERGLPFANAAASFVDQLRALDQSYGIGEPISERDTGVRPARDEDTELEQKVIELSLKSGDIHPTMISAIANNDLNGALLIASQKLSGFSAELAKTLLNLKLPTNISFNNGRDLVRRSIDNMSAPQQQRLFRYVEMHYPQVYNKYFTNYDRSESLETVMEGLVELQKPKYKLGPVITEFGTVSGAYEEHIKGLTSPGAYYPRFDEIILNTNTLSGKSYRVFLHEVVHAATEYTLNTYGTNPQSLTPGQRESVKELTRMYNYALKEIGTAPYGMTNIYEFISEAFTNKKFQEILKGIKYKSDKPTFLSKLIKAIFKAVGFDNLASNAMVEATNIFSAVRSQTTVDRGPRFAKSGPKSPRVKGPISTPQAWRTAESQTTSMIGLFNDALKGRRSWDEVLKIIGPSMWNANTGRFRRAILGVANLRQIDDLTKTKFPQISGAVRIIEQMLAYRGNIMKTAEDITKEWTKAQAKKPKQGQLMGRVMIEATIRGIDPDRPGTKTVNAALVQAWNQLDPEFKQIYRQVRDFYANSVKSMVREMKSKIAKSNRPLSEKKAAIREINDKFGPDKLVQPYFPLRRFGKHWFQVGKGNFKEFYEFESPINRELAMRSRVAELRKGNVQQQALADTIRKGSGLSELFTQNITTTKVLKEAQDIIDNVTATTIGDAKKEMKDSLNQLIYILLPQQSMRKMFINRKAIQGASGDMLRVFATSAVHSAYQQSRFKFAEPFLNNLTNAVEYVEEFSDRDRASVYRDYIQEVEKRAPTILSNEDTSLAAVVAGRASELTFFYMLSAPFSAMLNLLGVAQVTMPYIGGRYGYAKTNALMIKNFGRYFATMPSRTISPLVTGSIMQAQFPSIVEGGKLTGILKRAADRFIEEGQINISLTNDLMDMGDRPSALYTGRYNMVKKMLSGLFHQSERLGREVSLLTTFELAYDKLSKSPKKDLRGVIERDAQGNPVMNTPDEAFELAISEAKDIVGLSLGDFTRQMKPRYFVSPLMSVITKFKQYSVLATYAVIRNFYFTVAAPFRKAEIEEFRQQMVKDKISPKVIEQRLAEAEAQRKELYREGRRRLAGILGVTFLLGGNEASPFYSIGIGTLVKMLADEEDDEFFDWENWLKNYMEEELGGAAGDFFAEMGMNPETADDAGRFVGGALQRGLVSELTGGDLASRVSLDPKSLWYREGRYSSDVRESIVEDVIANAGPVVGLGFNWIDSYRLFQEGQYQRAFEKAAPALISKPVAAERIADEGAKTASGIKLADNFSAWEIAMLSIGLQPTRLAQAQKSAIEAKQYTEKIKDRRTTLLTRLWMERDNFAGYTETMETITKFNLKYPNYAISGENIKDSFDRRGKNQAKAGAIGGQFDDKALPDALQMLRYGRN